MGTRVTASAGNHGLAMATAAARLGIGVRVHMPSTAPRAKREALLAQSPEQPSQRAASFVVAEQHRPGATQQPRDSLSRSRDFFSGLLVPCLRSTLHKAARMRLPGKAPRRRVFAATLER